MKPLGCFVVGSIAFIAVAVVCNVYYPDTAIHLGEQVVIGEEGGPAVWLAAGIDDYEPMLEAEERAARGGRGDGEMRFRLAEAKRIFLVAGGSSAEVRDNGFGWVDVKMLDGDKKGQVGRVQRELVKKR